MLLKGRIWSARRAPNKYRGLETLERGVEGASIVTTTNNRKCASPKMPCLKKYTHQKNHGLKRYAFHQKAKVTWHNIEAYTSTLRHGVFRWPSNPPFEGPSAIKTPWRSIISLGIPTVILVSAISDKANTSCIYIGTQGSNPLCVIFLIPVRATNPE